MKLATWNINSIRARQERLLGWLDRQKPDVVCLQETKVEDAAFPCDEIKARGYHAITSGQRTYNGVAILSRTEPTDILRGLDDGEDDTQARLLAATVEGVRILSAYVPNGQVVGSEKWDYKLQWLERLRNYLARRCDAQSPLALCGDFNVAPEERDVHDPVLWQSTVLFHPDARAALERVRGFGFQDSFRLHHEEPGRYTWWDYRQLSFPKNKGLRIDHVFLTGTAAARCRAVEIDREARKGKLPSDHAPVIVTIE